MKTEFNGKEFFTKFWGTGSRRNSPMFEKKNTFGKKEEDLQC